MLQTLPVVPSVQYSTPLPYEPDLEDLEDEKEVFLTDTTCTRTYTMHAHTHKHTHSRARTHARTHAHTTAHIEGLEDEKDVCERGNKSRY